MAFTHTITKTATRSYLIEVQVMSAFRRAIPSISEKTLLNLKIGIKYKWIKHFGIYGMDQNNLCRAQVILEINWKEHIFQMKLGNENINTNKQWKNDVAIEVDEVLNAFMDVIEEHNLRTKWTVSYDDWVYNDKNKLNEVRDTLGFSQADTIKWKGEKNGVNLRVSDLSEIKVGLYLSE